MHSCATVVILLDDGVVFIGALDGAEFGGWLPKVAQTLDDRRQSVPGGAQMADPEGPPERDRSQELLRRAIREVAGTCAV